MLSLRLIALPAVAFFAATAGAATAAEDFYKGKTLTIITSGSGSYEAYARLVGKYMSKYIPGEPNIVVKQIQGASGLKAANYLYTQAPKDGTEIAGTHGHIPTAPVFSSQGIEYDPTKFGWIGNVTKEIFLGYFWNGAPVQSFEQARGKETVVGGQALGSMSIDIPVLANAMMGTKFKIITGYTGANEVRLALERGEISGVFGTSWSSLMTGQPEWIKDKKINVVVQFGDKPHSELPNVPSLYNYVLNAEDREALEIYLARQETGKPYFAPPGVPPERLAILRRAFDMAMKDADLKKDFAKANLDQDGPMTGQEVEQFIARRMATPAKYVDRINTIFSSFNEKK
jgi:tripartite-type tricarboxylate transporter receptor subunit TctC